MATIPRNTDGYSARVNLELHVQGKVFGLAKVGPDRVVLQDDVPIPAGAATLVISIGASTKRQAIMIDETRCDGREIGYR